MTEDQFAKLPPEMESSSGNPVQPRHAEHRERLRERFRKGGADALRESELLELILFRSLPGREVKSLSESLIEEFGSFAEAIGASPESLMKVEGINRNASTDLKLIHSASIKFSWDRAASGKNILDSWGDMIDFCHAMMAYGKKELFVILFLDKKKRLIGNEIHQTGTVDHAPVYIREIVTRAKEYPANSIILAHNHPSGDSNPSQEDFDMTKEILKTAKSMNVEVYDHLIIGKENHYSFRGMGKL